MTDHVLRPLLFLDVDGPLLPFGDAPQHEPGSAAHHAHLAGLSRALGARLAALPCELVWASTWEDGANEEVAPRLGLPRLAVVNWPEPSGERERVDRWFGLHWKTQALVEWAAGRSFAWVDDEITDADQDWVSAHYRGQALLHRVESYRGLTNADFKALEAWLRAA